MKEDSASYRAFRDSERSGSRGRRRKSSHTNPGAATGGGRRSGPRREGPWPYEPPEELPESSFKLPFDPWRFLDVLQRRWKWLLAGAAGAAMLAFLLGIFAIDYSVKVALIRRQSNATVNDDTAKKFMPTELNDETLMNLIRSGEVANRVARRAQDPSVGILVTAEEVAHSIKIIPTANPDIVVLSYSGMSDLPAMVKLVNFYAEEAIKFTKELQASESSEVNNYLKEKLKITEEEIKKQTALATEFARESGFLNFDKETQSYVAQLATLDVDVAKTKTQIDILKVQMEAVQKELNRFTPENDRLAAAREQLSAMLIDYTEAHPKVQTQRARIEALEQEAKNNTGSSPAKIAASPGGSKLLTEFKEYERQKLALEKQLEDYEAIRANEKNRVKDFSEKALQFAAIQGKLKSLEVQKSFLQNRQTEAQLFVESPMGYYRQLSIATMKDLNKGSRWFKIAFLTLMGGVAGLLCSAAFLMFTEAVDVRIKTATDLARVTQLPVLGTLGDLKTMDPQAQVQWAFKTLTNLRGKLTANGDDAIVCGFISARHGEGKSTWIDQLVSAANQRGLRVLKIDTVGAAAAMNNHKGSQHGAGNGSASTSYESQASATRLLAAPAELTKAMEQPDSAPVVHIPIPGWVWSLERRNQWQRAITEWRGIDNLVLLVELPPASEPEAILLAENLPQVIWLAGSGQSTATETLEYLEVLRNARCRLVGAVLNREPKTFWKSHWNRVFRRSAVTAALLGLLSFSLSPTQAEQKSAEPPASAVKLAPWQERLTLGPGDAVDIQLFGYPDLTRTNVMIGPDGKLNYLQAEQVNASGMTIDELREHLDKTLGQYYRAAKVIVQPVSFQSKKYYLLGKVNTKGVFTLDRPMTLIEAVARARGLETGLYDRNTVELADLGHSFIIRDGKRLQVDLEKLFAHGDFSQNVAIEPGDYIYFASAGVNEIYLLGEVMNPGPIGFATKPTLLSALTDKGGFTEKAYKKKILVVRGSLNEPQTFVVDAGAILAARASDFRLEPKDIVYVSKKPWAKVEELLDEAAQAFIQGAITAWAGGELRPIIRNPILPEL